MIKRNATDWCLNAFLLDSQTDVIVTFNQNKEDINKTLKKPFVTVALFCRGSILEAILWSDSAGLVHTQGMN